MFLIYALGNFGIKYENTRHNIGVKIAEEFANKYNWSFSFDKKSKAFVASGNLEGRSIVIGKPGKGVAMNISGGTVEILTNEYRISPSDLKNNSILIIHDDIDLRLGEIKISKAKGAAGHKGVESVIKKLKTKDFIRFRIGIRPLLKKPSNVEKFVLQKFNKDEKKTIKEVIQKTAEAIEDVLKGGLEKAMNKYNK